MARSLRGHCLIASKTLRDPNFYKTVVFLVEHGKHGAMGLVLNRPSTILVRNALAEFFDLENSDSLVHIGGPVEPAALLVLHNIEEVSGDEAAVVPGVFIGNSEEAFREVVRQAAEDDPDLNYRIFSGCAGWAPGQLEGEIARGDWLTTPVDSRVVYDFDPYDLYDELLHRIYVAHRLFKVPCPNPEWN